MIVLYFLLNILQPQQPVKLNVEVNFEFKSMGLGKPTLAFYHYEVTMNNKTDQQVYIVIPRWFGDLPESTGKVSGAQYDNFDKTKAYTIFSNSSITIFALKPKEKLVIKDYDIETFDESIQKKLTTGLRYIVCTNITVGTYSLLEFMDKDSEYSNNLEYNMENPVTKDITISTSAK